MTAEGINFNFGVKKKNHNDYLVKIQAFSYALDKQSNYQQCFQKCLLFLSQPDIMFHSGYTKDY